MKISHEEQIRRHLPGWLQWALKVWELSGECEDHECGNQRKALIVSARPHCLLF